MAPDLLTRASSPFRTLEARAGLAEKDGCKDFGSSYSGRAKDIKRLVLFSHANRVSPWMATMVGVGLTILTE